MTQSQQQTERKFIAVDFRGIQHLSRERTAIEIHGAAGIDVLAALPGPLPTLDELDPDATPRPPAGAAGAVSFGLGGDAARAACAYATLGGLAAFAGTLGADPTGDLILRWLSDRGVDVSHVARTGATTVRLLLAPAGHLTLSVSDATPAGAAATEAAPAAPVTAPPRSAGNGAPRRRSTRAARPSATTPAGQPRTLLVAGYPHIGALRGAATRDLLRDARARGLTTVLSLSPLQLAYAGTGGDGPALTPDDLAGLLPEIDLLCGGAPELRRATRRSDPHEAARAVLDAGVRAVLVKRGPAGATVFRAGSSGLVREDTPTPTTAATVDGLAPLRLAATFGAVYDAAYLLGLAVNDTSPIRFAAAAAARAATSPSGVLAM